jgi:hypothetical protein
LGDHHVRDTRFRQLCNKHATAGSCKFSAIGPLVWILNEAALVLVHQDGAIGGVDDGARLNGIDDGAARRSVQCHLSILYQIDGLKRVNLAVCRPILPSRPECGPHGALGTRSQSARHRGSSDFVQRFSEIGLCFTYPEWDVHYVRNPQTADGKAILRRDAYRVAIGVGWNDGRIVDLHDRISRIVDERKLLRRGLRRV